MQRIIRIFLLCGGLCLAQGLPAQKVTELKFTDVRQAAGRGEAVITGQGFTPASGSFFGRLSGELDSQVRKEVRDLGKNSAGIAVRFRTNSKCIGARWTLLNNFTMAHMAGTGIRGLDLYSYTDGEWIYAGTAQPNGKESSNIFRRGMDGEYRDYMLYLPLYDGVTELAIGIDSNAVLEHPGVRSLVPGENGRPIVFYGTSITQGGCVSRPGMAYPAIIGRKLNKETVNLGFSGNGRMDKSMAGAIAGMEASAIVVDCLPNCTYDIVRDSTEYFIKTIAAAHPQRPVYMVSNYCYPYQYLDAAFREELLKEDALWYSLYLKMRKEGLKNIRFVDLSGGGKMKKAPAGPDHEGTVDGVHLTDLGSMRLAEIYCKILGRKN